MATASYPQDCPSTRGCQDLNRPPGVRWLGMTQLRRDRIATNSRVTSRTHWMRRGLCRELPGFGP